MQPRIAEPATCATPPNQNLRIFRSENRCVSCRKPCAKKTSRRGICRICYGNPQVREKFPRIKNVGMGSPSVTSSKLDHKKKRGLPLPKPTNAVPGSPEKVRVLEMRFALKQQMHHPDDAKLSAMRDSDFADFPDEED